MHEKRLVAITRVSS